MVGGDMDKNDWRYFDDEWDEEEKKDDSDSPQKQCSVCLRWIDQEVPYCGWCGGSQFVKK